MNEYMKPDYEVMEFAANEYVAGCPWIQGTILELFIGCGTGTESTKITLGGVTEWNETYKTWYGNVTDQNGNNTQGMLWQNSNYNPADNSSYQFGFQGYVPFHEHEETATGEYKGLGGAITDNDKNGIVDGGSGNSAYYACNCQFFNGAQSNFHHHVTGFYNVTQNRS